IYPLFTFYLPKRQQVITYPISGFDNDLRPGKRRFNFIWYRVADPDRLREMCVDENGVQHEHSVPPPLIRKDLIAQMHKDAREILPPALLDSVMKIKQPFITPIYDFTAPAIVFGRVAMVGDAAANARPHMGFGMAKAGIPASAGMSGFGYERAAKTRLRAQHAHRRPQRPERPTRRRPGDGASRFCLCRPHVLQGFFRHRRTRREKSARGELRRRAVE